MAWLATLVVGLGVVNYTVRSTSIWCNTAPSKMNIKFKLNA